MLTPLPSDCLRARESASARVDGELDELEAARLDAHLRACTACRAFAADSEELAGRLRAAALDLPPADLFVPHARRRVRTPLVAAAAAVVVAAVTGSSVFLGGLPGRSGGKARTLADTTTPSARVFSESVLLSMLRDEEPDGPLRLRAVAV